MYLISVLFCVSAAYLLTPNIKPRSKWQPEMNMMGFGTSKVLTCTACLLWHAVTVQDALDTAANVLQAMYQHFLNLCIVLCAKHAQHAT